MRTKKSSSILASLHVLVGCRRTKVNVIGVDAARFTFLRSLATSTQMHRMVSIVGVLRQLRVSGRFAEDSEYAVSAVLVRLAVLRKLQLVISILLVGWYKPAVTLHFWLVDNLTSKSPKDFGPGKVPFVYSIEAGELNKAASELTKNCMIPWKRLHLVTEYT